jgi:phosphonate transport system substrate-binding protein
MAADQVDFVLTGPAEYVVFQARLKAVPVVGWSRPDYFSQIVVLAGGPIKTLNDLKGKKISFGEIGSTSQHLGPAQILVDGGLTYARDYEPVFLRLNVAVEALKQGDIAAIGMNLTHIQRIRQANPGVAFLVLERGRDLPDDILLASPKVPAATLERVRKVFTDQGAQLIHKAVTSTKENAKFVGGTFLPTVTDRDYDIVRSASTSSRSSSERREPARNSVRSFDRRSAPDACAGRPLARRLEALRGRAGGAGRG